MVQDSTTYYVWIGGSCDYGHKERAGGAAVVIELMEQREQSQRDLNSAESRQKKTKSQHDGSIFSRDVISDLHTTEFRMMLTLMVKVMNELPDGSDILFLTDARSKSRDQTCLGFALQEGGRQSQPTQPTSRTLTRHLQRSLPIQTSSASVSRRKHVTTLLVSKSYHTTKVHCSSKHTTWQQKLWQRQEKNTTMTSNEQALFYFNTSFWAYIYPKILEENVSSPCFNH